MATQDVRLTATNPDDSSVVPVACNEKGELKLEEPLVVEGPPGEQGEPGPKGEDGDPFSGNFDGDVTFDGNVKSDSFVFCTNGDLTEQFIQMGGTPFGNVQACIAYTPNSGANFNWFITPGGSATFAGGKAGFTAQGHLWCTPTSGLNGQRYILERVSQGMALWAEYDPARDFEEWAEKNVLRPKPEDSSQDEPETKQ